MRVRKGAACRHLQESCEAAAGRDCGATNGDAQRRSSGRQRVQRSPAAHVHDLAGRAPDEVALAVDFLDETFALEHCEGMAQRHRAHGVPLGQGRLGRESFAGLETAGRDLLP